MLAIAVRTRARRGAAPSGGPPALDARWRASGRASTDRASGRPAAPTPARRWGRTRSRPSPRAGRDPAAARALGERQRNRGPRIGADGDGEGQDADVACPAPVRRQAVEGGEQQGVVLGIRGVLAGIAPGADARAAIEGIHFQAGVVGEGRQSGGARPEPGLDRGVGPERRAGLLRVARDPEVVQRDELAMGQVQQLPEFAKLVRRPGRDQQARPAHRRTVARMAACASNSWARPASARSIRPFAATRSNGLPSAVPWSST